MSDLFSEKNNIPNIIYANFGERLGAFLIDSILLWISLAFLGNLLHEKTEYTFIGIIFSVKGTFLQIITTWLYFSIQEASIHEGTLGKRAFKIRVTNPLGHRISFGKASVRYFSKFISYFILAIGFLMMLWNKEHQTLHDKIANTFVVK